MVPTLLIYRSYIVLIEMKRNNFAHKHLRLQTLSWTIDIQAQDAVNI